MLAGACQQRQGSLILLTSRFPFADLETFDGGGARMLDVPPFTPAEGAALLAAAGGDWVPDGERRSWWPRSTGTRWRSGRWPAFSLTGPLPAT